MPRAVSNYAASTYGKGRGQWPGLDHVGDAQGAALIGRPAEVRMTAKNRAINFRDMWSPAYEQPLSLVRAG